MVNQIMKKFPKIPKKDVYQIFILSHDEYLEAVSSVPNIPIEQNCAWWLRSVDGTQPFSAVHFVNQQGEIESIGPYGHSNAIRPAFRCHNMCTYKPGDKVAVGTLTCTVIDAATVLCDETLGHVYFGGNAYYWKSHLKDTIEDPEFLTEIYCF